MKLKLILLVAIMSLAVTAGAFAAVENIRISGDINAEGVVRDLTLGDGGNSESFVLSQIRLRIDADLTEGVGATIGLINERLWGQDSTRVSADGGDSFATNKIDLDLAYIQLDDFMGQPMMVRIGRQNLRYGNALIIGDSGISDSEAPVEINDLSLRQSFDAARVVMDYAPYTLDLFYAKIDEGDTDDRDDTNLWGINLGYDWASHNGVTEVYYFYQDGPRRTAPESDSKDGISAVGARAQFDLNDHLTLGGEGAYQFGKVSGARLRAYAGQMTSEYRFLDVYNSKIGLDLTYLSGNSDAAGRNNAWQPMYEDQAPAEIINRLFANTNMMYTTLSGSMMPQEDVTLGLQWTMARLASSLLDGSREADFINNYSFTLVDNERDVGHEVNASVLYDYTEDVQLSLKGAWFMPGDLFTSANDSTAYSIRAGVNVDF